MIARLRGIVDSVGLDWAVIDVNGVGYLVSCSGRTLSRLQAGQEAVLQVETQMREDSIRLFAFADIAERDWFRLLQTVQGVGGKVALSILTVLTPEQLLQAFASGDRVALSRADGVGPKLATRLLSELKDKVVGMSLGASWSPTAAAAQPAGKTSVNGDAVSALVNLGYGRSEAFGAVAAAAKKLGDAADLNSLIRAGLQELSA
jgi:Holliday junction DNA helicase RuvA